VSEPRLSEDARALLRRFDRQHALPAGVEIRVARRLHATLGDAEDLVIGGAARARARGVAIAAALLAVAAGMLVWWSWPTQGTRLADGSGTPLSATDRAAGEDEAHGEAVPGPEALPARAPAPSVVPDESAAPQVEVAVPERRESAASLKVRRGSDEAAEREGPTIAPAATTSTPSSLAQEMTLLSRAQTALRSGRPNDALQHLVEHARRHPDSSLAQERAALRVLALCDAGRTVEAARERTAFLDRHADSPLRARVREACPEDSP
jgi:hypothetical protein